MIEHDHAHDLIIIWLPQSGLTGSSKLRLVIWLSSSCKSANDMAKSSPHSLHHVRPVSTWDKYIDKLYTILLYIQWFIAINLSNW